MRNLFMPLLMFTLITPVLTFAQGIPEAAVVVNSGSYDELIAPESLATLFGKNLSVGEFKAEALPLTTKLGETEVFSCTSGFLPAQTCPNGKPCCVQAELLYVGPDQINLRMPPSTDYPIVNRDIIVRVAGSISKPTRANLEPAAPGIFEMGWDCGIDPRRPDTSPCGLTWDKIGANQARRAAVTDQVGSLITAANPARITQYYTVWLTGLGKITNGKTIGTVELILYGVPVYGYAGTTWMYSTVTWAGPSPEFPGLYQINFKLPDWLMGGKPEWHGYPPMHPCGSYSMELTMRVLVGSYGSENSVQLPLVIKNGDVPCVAR